MKLLKKHTKAPLTDEELQQATGGVMDDYSPSMEQIRRCEAITAKTDCNKTKGCNWTETSKDSNQYECQADPLNVTQ